MESFEMGESIQPSQRAARDAQPKQQEIPLMSGVAGSNIESNTKEKKERRRLFKRQAKN